MANYLGGGGFDPQAYMMRKMMDELFGTEKGEITKQNAQSKYMNTVNLYAGNVNTNWDSEDLAGRKQDIDAFHNKIKRSPNYDPIIEEHISAMQSQIDNKVSINNNFNMNIDRLKNIDSDIIKIADEYINFTKSAGTGDVASDEYKYKVAELVDRAKKLTTDRSSSSSTMQKIDPTRWQNSSELQFLDKDAKTNSGYLMTAIKNDNIIDEHEYKTILASIDADDPNIIIREQNLKEARVEQRDKGLIEDVQTSANQTQELYQQMITGKEAGTLKGNAFADMENQFYSSLNLHERQKNLIKENMGTYTLDMLENQLFPDGMTPWENYGVKVVDGGGGGGDPPKKQRQSGVAPINALLQGLDSEMHKSGKGDSNFGLGVSNATKLELKEKYSPQLVSRLQKLYSHRSAYGHGSAGYKKELANFIKYYNKKF